MTQELGGNPAPKKYVNLSKIREAVDLQRAEVSTHEWEPDTVILVRSLTGRERDLIDQEIKTAATPCLRAKVVIMSAIHEDGTPIFFDADLDWLSRKSAAVLDRISEVVLGMSGFGAEADEKNKKLFTLVQS